MDDIEHRQPLSSIFTALLLILKFSYSFFFFIQQIKDDNLLVEHFWWSKI